MTFLILLVLEMKYNPAEWGGCERANSLQEKCNEETCESCIPGYELDFPLKNLCAECKP